MNQSKKTLPETDLITLKDVVRKGGISTKKIVENGGNKAETIKLSHSSEIEFRCYYPLENPKGSIGSITDALRHVGVFDGVNLQC